jgi:hypothetical protein
MSKQPTFIGPIQLKCVNFGIDTLLINCKFAGDDLKPNGDTLPETIAGQMDDWQAVARKEHKPVPTDLDYRMQTLFMRAHGSGVWSWLLFNDDLTLSFSYGSMNGGVFCQARFSSHLLWCIGPEAALVELQSMLYDFTRKMVHVQASEIHICADMQGWYEGPQDWQEGFVTRVVNIRSRPDEPTEREQQGGMSPKERRKLEQQIVNAQPIVTTTYRRLATLDFGSHGSEIMGQIYNKSQEIKKSKKTFFEPIWTANGWDGHSIIWRVEIRYRRKSLASFDLNEAFEVLSSVRLLWAYATEQWLRYIDRAACEDSNTSRLPAHPVWQAVQGACPDPVQEIAACDEERNDEARLVRLLDEKPLQVIEEAVALTVPEDVERHEPVASIHAVTRSFQEEAKELQQEVARDLLNDLSPEQKHHVIRRLSPEPFHEVRSALIKRAKRMARKKMCVPAMTGYLTSIMALAYYETAEYSTITEHPTGVQPDLVSSLRVAFEEILTYNKEKGRSHVEEVWKKRLAYGFVTAQQVEEERRRYGIELTDADRNAVQEAIDALKDRARGNTRDDRRSDSQADAA